MTNTEKVTEEQIAALDAFKLKIYGEAKSNYVKLDDGVPVTLGFYDWGKKDENGHYRNMWEEQAEGDNGSYKVAVFKVLDMSTENQQEKMFSISSKRLFGSVERLLKRGFLILEITKHKGQTQYDTTYDVIPVGGEEAK